MSKRNIILLVIFTIILIIVSIATVQRDPEISSVYFAKKNNLTIEELEALPGNPLFLKTDNIFLYINANSLKEEDNIKITWKKIEEAQEIKIQENKIRPEENGSGLIIVSMIKKDNLIAKGNYKVEIFLNNKSVKTKEFIVKN